MKLNFAIILSFLLLASSGHGRKDMGDYWKKEMKGQTMPEALRDLLVLDPPSVLDTRKDLFVRDFDIKPNIILYHSHGVHNKKHNNHEADQFDEKEALAAEETAQEGLKLPTYAHHLRLYIRVSFR